MAWIGGAEYTYGPAIVGGSYYSWNYQGALGLPTQRHDQGFALGLTYNIAPGLAFLAEYLYGQRHQGNYNFVDNVAGTAPSRIHLQPVQQREDADRPLVVVKVLRVSPPFSSGLC